MKSRTLGLCALISLTIHLLSACQKLRAQPDPLVEVASFYDLGKKALAEKDANTAINQFSKCILDKPENVDCHWELGWAYFLSREYEKAKLEWEIVQRLTPKREGLTQALEKITAHLKLRVRSLALRSTQLASFNPRRKPASNTIIKIHAVGDTMLGTNFPNNMLPPENISPLTNVIELLQGSDITFANYEGTLCDLSDVEGKCDDSEGTCYAFRSPTGFASYLKDAGFDLISLANNHIFDFGEDCREQTENSLSSLGLLWSGQSGSIARFERRGIKFSMIAFHSAAHTNSTLDLATAQKLVRAEKKAKRLVIVSFHGGAEGFKAMHVPKGPELFMGENRGEVIKFAHKVIDAGADLVLGSGPHVVRGMEIYKKRLIAYSLGNFATYKAFNLWGFNGNGLILEVELDGKGLFTAGRIIPTQQIDFGYPVYDQSSASTDLIRLLTLEDFPFSGVIIAQDGTLGTKVDAERKIASLKRAPTATEPQKK